MGESPLVSVLMGVYNEETYLPAAIDSILNQTYENLELIIVDDASTDSSREIIESYDDSRIVLLENETNRGLTVSLNRALETASGMYVARQDADDVSEPKRLEKQVEFLETQEEVALVGTGTLLINESDNVVDRRVGYCNPTYEDFLKKNRLVHGTILARRSAIELVGGYDEFFRYSQDYDLWLRLLEEHEIANIPTPLYRLRVHDESVYFTRRDESALYATFARHQSTGKADKTIKNELKEAGILEYWNYLSDEQCAAVHDDLTLRYLRYGHQEPALKECRKAIDSGGYTVTRGLFLALCYGGKPLSNIFHTVTRRYFNIKIRLHNEFQCPYV